MRPSSFRAFAFALLFIAGCGRTELDLFSDGAPHPFDGGPSDGGDDSLFCNGPEQCELGVCVPGFAVRCDDGVACTDDRCVETSDACESIPGICPDGTMCDPVLGCTPERCRSDFECNDGFVCNGS